MYTSNYKKQIVHTFEAGGGSWKILDYSVVTIVFEALQTAGQEDRHGGLVVSRSGDKAKWALSRCTREAITAYGPPGASEAVEAHFNEHGPPKAHTVIDEFVQTIDNTQLERLVCFIYLLTRGTPSAAGIGWGGVKEVVREMPAGPTQFNYCSQHGEGLAREIVAELLTGERPENSIPEVYSADETRDLETPKSK